MVQPRAPEPGPDKEDAVWEPHGVGRERREGMGRKIKREGGEGRGAGERRGGNARDLFRRGTSGIASPVIDFWLLDDTETGARR